MPSYYFRPKKSFISFSEASKMVVFPLLNGNLVARKENWSFNIFEAEKRVESRLHRQLKKKSISYFKKAGYKVNQTPVGVKGERVLSDYFMAKNSQFYFVECLTEWALKPQIIFKKFRLAKYAPLWLVIPTGIDLTFFPKKENVKILIV